MTKAQTISVTSSIYEAGCSNHELPDIGVAKSLNSETIAVLRRHLSEASARSSNWKELSEKLFSRGLYLQKIGRFLWLSDIHSHSDICPCRLLGFSSSIFEHRFNQNCC